jgi:hypothetical protein
MCFIKKLMLDNNLCAATIRGYIEALNTLFHLQYFDISADLSIVLREKEKTLWMCEVPLQEKCLLPSWKWQWKLTRQLTWIGQRGLVHNDWDHAVLIIHSQNKWYSMSTSSGVNVSSGTANMTNSGSWQITIFSHNYQKAQQTSYVSQCAGKEWATHWACTLSYILLCALVT